MHCVAQLAEEPTSNLITVRERHSEAGSAIVHLVFRSNDSVPYSPSYSLSRVTKLPFPARVQRELFNSVTFL
jgi:hypothetical protein